MQINWNDDLHAPKEPGEYRMPEIGMVIVYQKDIENAARIGGNLRVELVDVTAVKDPVPMYRIVRFLPA